MNQIMIASRMKKFHCLLHIFCYQVIWRPRILMVIPSILRMRLCNSPTWKQLLNYFIFSYLQVIGPRAFEKTLTIKSLQETNDLAFYCNWHNKFTQNGQWSSSLLLSPSRFSSIINRYQTYGICNNYPPQPWFIDHITAALCDALSWFEGTYWAGLHYGLNLYSISLGTFSINHWHAPSWTYGIL